MPWPWPSGGACRLQHHYGGCPKDADQALAGACPIMASYGGKDCSPDARRRIIAFFDRHLKA